MNTKLDLPKLTVANGRHVIAARVQALGKMGAGTVEAYASVFDVTFYEYGLFSRRKVRIEKGAFAQSLKEREAFPLMWEHDWLAGPVGHTIEEEEDDEGLRALGQIYIDTERGSSIWRSMEAKAITEWSVGFYPEEWKVEKAEDDEDEEVTVYTRVDLAELTVAVRGANPETRTVKVNSAGRKTIEIDGVTYVEEGLEHKAIAPHSSDVVDEEWDGPGEEAKIPNDSTAETYRAMYAWNDPDKDADTKAAYKFPHHKVTDGKPKAANVRGVRNGLARLPQANIPDADRDGVRRHLQKHLDDFKEESKEMVPGAEKLLARAAIRNAFRDTVTAQAT